MLIKSFIFLLMLTVAGTSWAQSASETSGSSSSSSENSEEGSMDAECDCEKPQDSKFCGVKWNMETGERTLTEYGNNQTKCCKPEADCKLTGEKLFGQRRGVCCESGDDFGYDVTCPGGGEKTDGYEKCNPANLCCGDTAYNPNSKEYKGKVVTCLEVCHLEKDADGIDVEVRREEDKVLKAYDPKDPTTAKKAVCEANLGCVKCHVGNECACTSSSEGGEAGPDDSLQTLNIGERYRQDFASVECHPVMECDKDNPCENKSQKCDGGCCKNKCEEDKVYCGAGGQTCSEPQVCKNECCACPEGKNECKADSDCNEANGEKCESGCCKDRCNVGEVWCDDDTGICDPPSSS